MSADHVSHAMLDGYTTDLIFGAYAEGVSGLGTPAVNYTIVR